MSRRGPRPIRERLGRLLVILPWLADQGGSMPLAEVARVFGVPERALVDDLTTLSLCGVPPYTPDALVDLVIDEEEGWVTLGPGFSLDRPLRFRAGEALALLAGLRAALELAPADTTGPLARAASKLEQAVGSEVVVAVNRPPAYDTVVRAQAGCQRLAVTYWSAGRDELTERRIDPQLVFSDRGLWYVVADDERSGEERVFRLDRIRHVEPTGETFHPRAVVSPVGDWFDADDGERVTVRLPASAAWLAERAPAIEVEHHGDGSVTATFVVVSERWLDALLLQAGPESRVLAPPTREGAAATAARRVLARYG